MDSQTAVAALETCLCLDLEYSNKTQICDNQPLSSSRTFLWFHYKKVSFSKATHRFGLQPEAQQAGMSVYGDSWLCLLQFKQISPHRGLKSGLVYYKHARIWWVEVTDRKLLQQLGFHLRNGNDSLNMFYSLWKGLTLKENVFILLLCVAVGRKCTKVEAQVLLISGRKDF